MRDYPGQACSYIPEQAPEDIHTWLNSYFTMDNSTSYQQVASFSERLGIGLGSLDIRRGSGAQPPLNKIASLFAPSLRARRRVFLRVFSHFLRDSGSHFGSFFWPPNEAQIWQFYL